jgi:hypothetical protein
MRYQVTLHKRRWLDDSDSVPFGYIKDEQSGSTLSAYHEHVLTPFRLTISGKMSLYFSLFSNAGRLYSVKLCDIVRCFSETSSIPREQVAEFGRRITAHRVNTDIKKVS